MKISIMLSILASAVIARPNQLYQSRPRQSAAFAVASATENSASARAALLSPHPYIQGLGRAPIGPDGRVQDTLEVSLAKEEHAAAHELVRARLASEAARNLPVSVVPDNLGSNVALSNDNSERSLESDEGSSDVQEVVDDEQNIRDQRVNFESRRTDDRNGKSDKGRQEQRQIAAPALPGTGHAQRLSVVESSGALELPRGADGNLRHHSPLTGGIVLQPSGTHLAVSHIPVVLVNSPADLDVVNALLQQYA